MKKIAIFASGSGTNAEEILRYFKHNTKQGKVVTLISNNDQAFALQRAQKYGVPTMVIDAKTLRNNPEQLLDYLRAQKVDFIVLAGFMLLMPKEIVREYRGKMVNIHPALLPKYGGKGMYGDNVHRAVVEANEKESGITIHYVTEEYDKGAIIFQAKAKLDVGETPETLAQKIHTLEHKHYAEVIAKLITDDIGSVVEQCVRVLKAGGTILYPTDTVWGIGCDATNQEAVKKIYEIKQREDSKAMIVLVKSIGDVARYVRTIPPIADDLLEAANTEGAKPLTVIMEGGCGVANNLLSPEKGTIAIRVPRNQFLEKLLAKFNGAIISTSANISGEPTPTNYHNIDPRILSGVDYSVSPAHEKGASGSPSSIIYIGEGGEIEVIRS